MTTSPPSVSRLFRECRRLDLDKLMGLHDLLFYYLVCEAIGTAATPSLLCQPRAIVKMIVEKQMKCRLNRGNGENLPQRHFCPSQNPTWQDPGLNPGLRGGKPATNSLSYGAASPLPVTGTALPLPFYHPLYRLCHAEVSSCICGMIFSLVSEPLIKNISKSIPKPLGRSVRPIWSRP
jgi:hypothetical protein